MAIGFNPDDQERELIPKGKHRIVVVDVVYDGQVVSQFGNEQPKTREEFTIICQSHRTKDDGSRWLRYETFGMSLHEKAKLSNVLTTWSEEKLGPDARRAIAANLEKFFLLRQGEMQISHQPREDNPAKDKAVASYFPLTEGDAPLEPVDYIRLQDQPQEKIDKYFQNKKRPAGYVYPGLRGVEPNAPPAAASAPAPMDKPPVDASKPVGDPASKAQWRAIEAEAERVYGEEFEDDLAAFVQINRNVVGSKDAERILKALQGMKDHDVFADS